jgi:peptidyl-prolyl cis-trans isomerase B (cyclophilin B)
MMRLFLLSTLALGAAGLAGCTDEGRVAVDGDDAVTEPYTETDGDTIALEVTAKDTEVALGEDIVFTVKLTNTGDGEVKVNVPRLGRRSVSFRVRQGSRVTTLERLNADVGPSGRLMYQPGKVERLGAGESIERAISTPAIAAGEFAFVPNYRRQGAEVLTGEAITITVPPGAKDATTAGVHLETTHGALTVRMRPDLAYNTCESFVSLTKKGYFDGLTFHRVIQGFMAQGGDPKGDGSGGPGYFLPLEAHSKLLHRRGVLSMARTGNPHTAGSQFFLMFSRWPSLDPGPRSQGYTVFGEVLEGEKTLSALEAVGAPEGGASQAPTERIEIKKATVVLVK